MHHVYSPKIQRLVTPLRLQPRRHLRSLKLRRLEHQKEQKAEYECVLFLFFFFFPLLLVLSVFQRPYRKAHRREEGEDRCYQSITQEVRLFVGVLCSSDRLMSYLQGRVIASFLYRVALYFNYAV
jgi:hypothetical protein